MTAIVIAVSQSKGGCAKTTTSVNLAGALNEFNVNTALIDWDINKPDAIKWRDQGNYLDWIVAVDEKNPKGFVDEMKKKYQVIIFDTPPNLERKAFEAVLCSDYVIIPSSTNFLDNNNTHEAIQLPLMANKPFKILMSRIKSSTSDGREVKNEVKDQDITFKEVITDRYVLAQCPESGQWIGEYAKKSDSHKQFLNLAQEVLSWISFSNLTSNKKILEVV